MITRHGLVVCAVWACGIGACTYREPAKVESRMIGGESFHAELVEFKLKDGTHCAALLKVYGSALSCDWGK